MSESREPLTCGACGAAVATIVNPLAGLTKMQRATLGSALALLGADASAALSTGSTEFASLLSVRCLGCGASSAAG